LRRLSPEEAELWSRVTATIKPLSRELNPFPASSGPRKAVAGTTSPAHRPFLAVAQGRPDSPKAAPITVGTTLDGTWDRRLRSGGIEPDVVLDLHGMSLDRAWSAIDRTLDLAIASGARIVLLVTGHHRAGDPPVERGKIRAAVHDWLAVSRHASSIAAVRGAHRRHGGGGSLYIILRRR